MAKQSRLLLLIAAFLASALANVIINEIMYHSRQGSEYDYIELYNNAGSAADISAWKLGDGVTFNFPAGSSIAANGYLVITRNRTSFLNGYGSFVDNNIVLGSWERELSNKGDSIALVDAGNNVVQQFKFLDSINQLADGFGSSLELICPTADPHNNASWRASPIPTEVDKLIEYSGSPGKANAWTSCSTSVTEATDKILVTEIMYDPVDEDSRYEDHEFLEFFNSASYPIDLSGWRLISDNIRISDSLRFTFPSGSVVPSRSYFLVVRNKAAIFSVYPEAAAGRVFGEYSGELKNGGDRIALVDTNGLVAAMIEYDASFPWPTGARGIGDEKYKGNSLSRVSLLIEASKSYNWIADTPSPGRANPGNSNTPKPIVTELVISQGESLEFFAPNTAITVTAKISPQGTYSAAKVQYYVEDIASSNEQIQVVQMTLVSGKDQTFAYTFAQGFPENTIVRFRIIVDSAFGQNLLISPRSNDVVSDHTFFVSPASSAGLPQPDWHLFIRTDDWNVLWYNMKNGTVNGIYDDTEYCVVNPKWNDKSDAIVAYKGVAYDVRAKYQGSGYNRFRGDAVQGYNPTLQAPTAPNPMLVLSWELKLEKNVKIDGKEEIFWIKPRDAGCNYVATHAMYNLGRQLGLFTPKIKFSRVNINGDFFYYYMDMENYSGDLVDEYIAEHNDVKCSHQASEETGILFKAGGYAEGQGVLSESSENWLEDLQCPQGTVTALQRLENSYTLITQGSWADHTGLLNLTNGVGGGPNGFGDWDEPIPAAGKAWLAQTFDINLMLNYLVLTGWAGIWDDFTGNHMLYQRLTDGKWYYSLWDMDSLFGYAIPCKGNPGCSLNRGEYGADHGEWQADNSGNPLKTAIQRAFRDEFHERYRLLSKTTLSAENVRAAFDEVAAALDPNAGGVDPTCINNMYTWHTQRLAYVQSTLGTATQTAAPEVCPERPAVTKTITDFQSAPGAPSAPAFSNGNKIYWSAPNNYGSAITGYTVQKSTNGGDDWSNVYTGADAQFSENFNSDSSDLYRVQATNAKGSGAWSEARAPNGESVTDFDSASMMSGSILLVLLGLVLLF